MKQDLSMGNLQNPIKHNKAVYKMLYDPQDSKVAAKDLGRVGKEPDPS